MVRWSCKQPLVPKVPRLAIVCRSKTRGGAANDRPANSSAVTNEAHSDQRDIKCDKTREIACSRAWQGAERTGGEQYLENRAAIAATAAD